MQNDQEVLDVIRALSSKGESGRLLITTGMTEGAAFFEQGDLVESRFGKLNGFQAINALASIRDADFSFDSSIAPPATSSISANERVLLKEFFGIGARAKQDSTASHQHVPERVVPLNEVEDRQTPDTLDVQPTAVGTPPFVKDESNLATPSFTDIALHPTDAPPFTPTPNHELVSDQEDETTLLKPHAARAVQRSARRSALTPGIRTAALLAVLTVVVAAAVGVLVYRFLERSSPLPVAGPVQTSPPATSNQDSAADLTGNWKVVNTVEQTSYRRYQNLEVGFDLAINQSGNEFTGTGQKVSENGRKLAGESRTPISVKGSIDGNTVEATFSEAGAARKSQGRFVWTLDRSSGAMAGTFASSAAGSSGKSAATKKPSTH